MSYERQNSMTRLEQYRARQAERIEAMIRAIDEGRTTVVQSTALVEEKPRWLIHDTRKPSVELISDKPFGVNLELKDNCAAMLLAGNRKSVTAASVETSLRLKHFILAGDGLTPVAVEIYHIYTKDGSLNAPEDGQLFSYNNAESGRVIPKKIVKRFRSLSTTPLARLPHFKVK